ncbi:MAG: hypothetical protein HY303_06845 [Candidatus Wallbacteria bacterium]|nr:hypothetical protein [Candidatus Wallbacteria bacterium]
MNRSGYGLMAGILLAALSAGDARAFTPNTVAAQAPRPNLWQSAALIPWGRESGQLQEQIHSHDPNVVSRGPGSVLAFEGGSFAVLDTLGSSVKEFDASGKLTGELKFPAYFPDRKQTLAIDMAASGPGEYWLLSSTHNVVLHVRDGEPIEPLEIPGAGKNALLMAISRDSSGTIYVLDADEGSLYRMDSAGHALSKLHQKDLQGMTIDSKGHVYDLRLAGKNDARHLELIRWRIEEQAAKAGAAEPGFEDLNRAGASVQSDLVAKIDSDLEINRMDVFGVDAEGNIYVTWSAGAIENPTRREVVRFDSSGKMTGRAPCPADPVELKFTHAKVVSADGAVFAVRVREKGLEILRLKKWPEVDSEASHREGAAPAPQAPAPDRTKPSSDIDFGRH